MMSRGELFNSWVYAQIIIAEALRADVYKEMMRYLIHCDKGVKTFYKLNK